MVRNGARCERDKARRNEISLGGEEMNLAKCPCGETPTKLFLNHNGQGEKWAEASPDCCGVWSIEFRTEYKDLDDSQCMELAVAEWNSAPRVEVD